MKQPRLPAGTPPLSSVLAVLLCDTPDGQRSVFIERETVEHWCRVAGEWEKLAAEFEAVVREAGLELEP